MNKDLAELMAKLDEANISLSRRSLSEWLIIFTDNIDAIVNDFTKTQRELLSKLILTLLTEVFESYKKPADLATQLAQYKRLNDELWERLRNEADNTVRRRTNQLNLDELIGSWFRLKLLVESLGVEIRKTEGELTPSTSIAVLGAELELKEADRQKLQRYANELERQKNNHS